LSTKRTLDEHDHIQLAAWAAAGHRLVDAAARLKMSPNTLRRIFSEDESAANAWQLGRSELHAELVSKLITKAKAGDTVSLLFALKCLFQYREGEALDGSDQRTLVTINLPAATSPEQYAKLIDVQPRPLAAVSEGSADA
jgi:hypothetical protein